MGDEKVQTAIDVLKAYVDGTLATDLCDELDDAIEKAFNVMVAEMDSGDYETPLTHSW